MKDNWKEFNLFEISDSSNKSFVDGDWIESPYITDEGIRLIQTGNIGLGTFKDKSKKYISEESFNLLRCTEVFPGDILICRLAEPIGRACIVPQGPERYITSVDVCILRVGKDFSKELIHQILNTDFFLKKAELLSGGSTRQRISRINLGKININLPPLPQQRKIANILSACDEVIEKTEAAIAKYQALKQGMMHDLFTRGIELKTGKLRPSYKDAPELYKESDLGMIPKEWEEIIFGNEINFLSGCPFSSAFFNEEKKGMPLIRIRDLLDSNQETYYNGLYSDSYLINEKDVLIGMDGDFHIVKWNNSPSLLNQRILKISEKKEGKLYLDYFYYYLFPFLLDVHNKTAATTVKHLSTKDISAAIRYLPVKSEQILSAKKLLSIDDKIQSEQSALAKYQQIKAGLMQDLLTGNVEVSVAEEILKN